MSVNNIYNKIVIIYTISLCMIILMYIKVVVIFLIDYMIINTIYFFNYNMLTVEAKQNFKLFKCTLHIFSL
jgi:hypothetical protein